MLVGQLGYHRHKHGEGLVLVGLQDVQEVVVFEEAHCAVSNLQVNTSNASHYSLEEAGDKVLDFVNFAHFQHLLELSQEESLLDAVGEWPVAKESLEE